MMENGLMINLEIKAKLPMLTKINIKEILLMEKNQVKEFITIIAEENIKDNGRKIKKVDMESSNMQIMIDIRVYGKMDKEMEMVYMNIQMAIFMMDNGLMT